jgi:hypothetical protein
MQTTSTNQSQPGGARRSRRFNGLKLGSLTESKASVPATLRRTEARAPEALLALPFVGRAKERARLEQLHAERQHALILGSAGVGKSALIAHLQNRCDFLLCPQSDRLAAICESLEAQLGLNADHLKLVPRKNRVLRTLAEARRTVVFDGVGWTTPRLASFLECVLARGPVWIVARSDHSWDIGHVWPLLNRVERVELQPFHLMETRECVAAAVAAGLIPREALNIVEWLHQRSKGSPLVLRELFEELAARRYDLSNPSALRRLDLDRRIHEVFPEDHDA